MGLKELGTAGPQKGIRRITTNLYRMPMRKVCLTSSLLALMFVIPGALASEPESSLMIDEEAEDCLEFVPEAVESPTSTNTKQVVLDVAVLLDGMTTAEGQDITQRAAKAYAPLGVELKPTFTEVDFPPTKVNEGMPTTTSAALLAQAKSHFGGSRPWYADVVYVITATAIEDAGGVADCIGGVRYPNRAFAIGQGNVNGFWLGVNFQPEVAAVIAAHEIGHLMGAHHHYANCAEGAEYSIANTSATPCTVMFNHATPNSLTFSKVSGAVVRGHALRFADHALTPPPPQDPSGGSGSQNSGNEDGNEDQGDDGGGSGDGSGGSNNDEDKEDEPDPSASPSPSSSPSPEPTNSNQPREHTRSVRLSLRRHLLALGRLSSVDGEATCVGDVQVRLERKEAGTWRRVASAKTGPDGRFRTRIPDRSGRYRVRVPESSISDDVCSATASRPIFHRH